MGVTDSGALKAEHGRPHDLGQFYILIDPGAHSSAFAERFERIAAVVADDEGARIPGAARVKKETVDVDAAFWESVVTLGSGPGV